MAYVGNKANASKPAQYCFGHRRIAGIFLASLIYFRHGRLFANRFLASYIFIYSLIIVDLLVWDLQLYQQRPYLRIFLLLMPFIMVPLQFLIFNWAIIIQTIFYLSLTLWLLRAYTRDIKNIFSNIEKVRLNWLRNLTVLMFFVATFFLLENILFLLDIRVSDKFNLLQRLLL